MGCDVGKISIDGVDYIKAPAKVDGNRVIVRTEMAGVHYGTIGSHEGQECTLTDSRRLWYWKGAASLSQLALEGTKNPSDCKFTVRVPEITLLGVIEIIPCTPEAVKSIEAVEEWRND
jgi:Ser-tRNA(Ala) deacylase AlaX